MGDPHAILIAGPTASGKSALALEQAWALQASGRDVVIVNADSMQVYPVLRVLTARPSDDEMHGIQHCLYGHASLDEPYSVAQWARDVGSLLATWTADGVVPIFVGGTGLYFRALETGLAPVPMIDTVIRADTRARLLQNGAAALHAELAGLDPEGADRLRPSDGQRIARALEVVLSTGVTLSEHQRAVRPALLDSWRLDRMIVEPPRPVLHKRIAERAEWMLRNGAREEVEALRALDLPPEATVSKAIGVAQIGAMLDGQLSQEEGMAKLIAATRQYAKRQSTWFRGQMNGTWRRISTVDGA